MTSAEAEHKVNGVLGLDSVISERLVVIKLLALEDQPLLVNRYSFTVVDHLLELLNGVGSLHLHGKSLTRESLDEDLHFSGHC